MLQFTNYQEDFNDTNTGSYSAPLKQLDLIIAIVLTIAVLLAGGLVLVPGVCGIFYDDAIYVITAKALALGKGYHLINLPGSPFDTKYPILYPALLALIWKIYPSFPANLIPMKWLTLITGSLAVSLSYLYLVHWKYIGRLAAACGTLLGGLSLWFLYCSTLTISEATFSMLLVLSLWFLERQLCLQNSHAVAEFFTGIVIALPFLCRVLGIAIIPLAVWLLFRSGHRLRWLALGMVAVIGPWIVWTLSACRTFSHDPIIGYYTDYAGWWYSSIHYLPNILVSNLCLVVMLTTAFIFNVFLKIVSGIPFIVSIILGIIPYIFLGKTLVNRRVLPVFMLIYLLIVIAWPWSPARFLMPLLPLLGGLMIAGMSAIMIRILPNKIAIGSIVGIVIFAVAGDLIAIRQKVILNHSYGLQLNQQLPAYWSSYQNLFSWFHQHANEKTVVASGLDTMLYLYTGCKGFRPYVIYPDSFIYGGTEPPLGTADELYQRLKQRHASYLVSMPGFEEEKQYRKLLTEVAKKYPQSLIPVFIDADPRFAVYEIR